MILNGIALLTSKYCELLLYLDALGTTGKFETNRVF